MEQAKTVSNFLVTSVNLDKRLARLARIEAARLNISRSAYFRLILERELGKVSDVPKRGNGH